MSSRRALRNGTESKYLFGVLEKKTRVWLLPRKDRPKYHYQDVV